MGLHCEYSATCFFCAQYVRVIHIIKWSLNSFIFVAVLYSVVWRCQCVLIRAPVGLFLILFPWTVLYILFLHINFSKVCAWSGIAGWNDTPVCSFISSCKNIQDHDANVQTLRKSRNTHHAMLSPVCDTVRPFQFCQFNCKIICPWWYNLYFPAY